MGKIIKSVKNERGMVSFIVTMVLMVVIALIVLGFSQLSRREQRQALDRQLSTQAYYAAESGVNDAIKAIHSGYGTNKTQCGPDGSPQFPVAGYGDVDSAKQVSYTCLLITQGALDKLDYSIGVGKAITADMTFTKPVVGPQMAKDVAIEWAVPSTGNYPDFPATASWPLLRVTATDLTGASPYSRDNLNSNSFTTFLYPTAAGTAASSRVTFSDQKTSGNLKSQGEIVKADCTTTPGKCIGHIIFTSPLAHILLRVQTIYAAANITITAKNPPNQAIQIDGGQAIIDATGKAQDVLRRIQVRVSSTLPGGVPSDFAVQSVDGICKQLLVNSSSSSSTDPLCL
jgi:hypothetical protein